MLLRRDLLPEWWQEVARVQEEMARTFGRRAMGSGLAINLWADDNSIYAEVDLPALDPDKLDVSVREGNELTITGERSAPQTNGAIWVRQERPTGQFTRVVTLPALVDAENVEARYENGVLKLTMPKSNAAKPRKIPVKS